MYQLILHHVYRKGPYAIDLSGAQSDGLVTAAGYLNDGVTPGSGALTFKSPYARVRVPPKPVWKHLFALKVEVVARIDALGARRNLVEGADSFAFFIDPAGHLWGTFNGPQYKGGPLAWQGANSGTNAPDGVARTVPIGRWTTLRYEHDGYASIRLFIDDALVATNDSLASGVPPVTGAGVNIGNWTLADQYQFDGAIDDVKIWRYDPDDVLGHFLCRGWNKKSAPCWGRHFEWLEHLLRDPHWRDRVLRLMSCITNGQQECLRQIRSRGEAARAESAKLAEEYRKLWCEAPIDGDEMRQWQNRFVRFLVELLGQDALWSLLEQIRICYLRSELPPSRFDAARCDPQFGGYIEGFVVALDKNFQPRSSQWHLLRSSEAR